MDKKAKETVGDLFVFLWMMFLTSLSIFLWVASFYLIVLRTTIRPPEGFELPKLGDEANLLFGAASLALIFFSIFLGILAVLGWNSIKKTAKREIEASTQKRIDELEKELRGRTLAIMGAMTGDTHSDPDLEIQTEPNKVHLQEAVIHLHKSYALLRDIKGLGKFMALNNLVYYSCLLKEKVNPKLILEQARTLKEVENESHANPYLLTYCRAVGQYSHNPQERSDAIAIIQNDLLLREPTALEIEEAKRCLALLNNELPKRP